MAIVQDVRNPSRPKLRPRRASKPPVTARRYAEKQYGSEQRQFQAGTSTVFLVLQRQTDLTAARTREVRAQADMGQAGANMDRALARTLETQNIQIK